MRVKSCDSLRQSLDSRVLPQRQKVAVSATTATAALKGCRLSQIAMPRQKGREREKGNMG